VLNLVRIHDPIDGRSLRIHERGGITAHRDRFGDLAQFKLNVQGVCLFRDDADIRERLLLEAAFSTVRENMTEGRALKL